MIRISLILASILSLHSFANSYENRYVTCIDIENSSNWHIALDVDKRPLLVTGLQSYGHCGTPKTDLNLYKNYFVLDENNFDKLKYACPKNYHTQPFERDNDPFNRFAWIHPFTSKIYIFSVNSLCYNDINFEKNMNYSIRIPIRFGK